MVNSGTGAMKWFIPLKGKFIVMIAAHPAWKQYRHVMAIVCGKIPS